jgi:hypothetical protein
MEMCLSRIWDLTGVGAGLFFLLALGSRITERVSAWQEVFLIVAGLLVGYIAADLLSGVVHWFCDTCFSETTPGIGRRLIGPFREHHRDPAAMTRHGLLELSGNSGWGVLPIVVPAWLSDIGAGVDSFAVSCGSFLMLTNLFHRWAHLESAAPIIRTLQRHGWILSPEAHARHHVAGRGAYCVMNGWMNPVLDRLTGVR